MLGAWRALISQDWFIGWRGRPSVRSIDDLATALAEEAAHVAQSATYAYLRARAGFMAPKLFAEPAFLDVLEVTRWEAFGAVLSDFIVIVEGAARPHLRAPHDDIGWREVFRRAVARYPAPAHRADGWQGFEDGLMARLRDGASRPAEAPDLVAMRAGRWLFAHLPLHPDVRRPDEELVVNSVRFRMTQAWDGLADRLDWPSLAADWDAAANRPA